MKKIAFIIALAAMTLAVGCSKEKEFIGAFTCDHTLETDDALGLKMYLKTDKVEENFNATLAIYRTLKKGVVFKEFPNTDSVVFDGESMTLYFNIPADPTSADTTDWSTKVFNLNLTIADNGLSILSSDEKMVPKDSLLFNRIPEEDTTFDAYFVNKWDHTIGSTNDYSQHDMVLNGRVKSETISEIIKEKNYGSNTHLHTIEGVWLGNPGYCDSVISIENQDSMIIINTADEYTWLFDKTGKPLSKTYDGGKQIGYRFTYNQKGQLIKRTEYETIATNRVETESVFSYNELGQLKRSDTRVVRGAVLGPRKWFMDYTVTATDDYGNPTEVEAINNYGDRHYSRTYEYFE